MFPIRTSAMGRISAMGSLAAVILASLLCAAPAAWAAGGDDQEDIQTRQVSTHGLDLSTPAGQATLHRRIAAAATLVCGSYDARDLPATRDYNECREQALADASVQARVLIARAVTSTMSVADARTSAR